MKAFFAEHEAMYTDCIPDQGSGAECSEIGDCPDCPMDDD